MKRIAALAAVGLLLLAGTAAAAISVTTFAAKPAGIHLGRAPQCTGLRYRLSARAEDVELKIVNAARHEVWDVDRERSGTAAGRVFAFRWCGQSKGGHKIVPGRYLWQIEADQAGTNAEARSAWHAISVSR